MPKSVLDAIIEILEIEAVCTKDSLWNIVQRFPYNYSQGIQDAGKILLAVVEQEKAKLAAKKKEEGKKTFADRFAL